MVEIVFSFTCSILRQSNQITERNLILLINFISRFVLLHVCNAGSRFFFFQTFLSFFLFCHLIWFYIYYILLVFSSVKNPLFFRVKGKYIVASRGADLFCLYILHHLCTDRSSCWYFLCRYIKASFRSMFNAGTF